MRLKNKKTGEIIELAPLRGIELWGADFPEAYDVGSYDSLAELNEEWEDVPEEPKGYWFIDCAAPYPVDFCEFNEDTEDDKLIGNYFETKEEAQKAVERLRAWKRLKDKGFRFRWIDMQTGQIKYSFFLEKGQRVTSGDEDDLLTLFGGEE